MNAANTENTQSMHCVVTKLSLLHWFTIKLSPKQFLTSLLNHAQSVRKMSTCKMSIHEMH